MFDKLTDKMHELYKKLSRQSKMTETNLQEAISEVRIALLEADVNYGVVKKLVHQVKEKSLGQEVIKSLTPGQQFIKIVHDELELLMGSQEEPLCLKRSPSIILLCGLQGSGKTTTAAKLAHFGVKKQLFSKPLLVACDLQRLAAVDQLRILAEANSLPFFSLSGEKNPIVVAKAALDYAKKERCDVLIVDTAGRLHIDEPLMEELQALSALLLPEEILYVANGAQGQDAVKTAKEFNDRVPITGTILTMLDGSARGGAAISIREITGKPLKFEGVGEKISDLQPFHPGSMADRILGMGDTINLVRRAQEHVSEEEAKKLEEKILKATFTFDDYLRQIHTFRKMGPLKSLLAMMPGAAQMKDFDFDEKEIGKIEAMIFSMTPAERYCRVEFVPSRRHRIARGSGTQFEDVNRLIKTFDKTKTLFKNMPDKMKQFQKMMGG